MESPEYTAVMLWVPTESDEVLSDALAVPAIPLEPRVTVPRSVAPSKKSTLPVGVAPGVSDCADTSARRVIDWP